MKSSWAFHASYFSWGHLIPRQTNYFMAKYTKMGINWFLLLGNSDMKSAVKKRTQPVWVANRNTPISDKSGKLIIDSADDNLKTLHGKGNPIVISSIQAVGNTSATLEKNGNFVLHEMYSNGSKLELEPSFDYPTDTFPLGIKLGINT
ncbi:hypothetical protein Patl1_34184 [Pistacia atlantica]|uniref:Uncharacterized protein n=1 Tax=Pistacia atlantica TaxID=434234 RepID=A0ACC0ZSH6_9ROSI|nr:hypothetical protein Patl1_34184 [Pistacia atlantica]